MRLAVAGRGGQPALQVAVALLDEVHAVHRDGETRLVVAGDELLLGQVPDRELEMLARLPGQLGEFEGGKRRTAGLGAPPRIEDLEDRGAYLLLDLEVVGPFGG